MMMAGFGAFVGILFWLVGLAVAGFVMYWVIRLAVRHALRDVQGGPPSGPPRYPGSPYGGAPQ